MISLLMLAEVTKAAEEYLVKDLGPLTNLRTEEPESRAYGINAGGKIAAGNVINGAYRAVIYGGVWTNIGTLGGSESMGFGINDAGQVVGRSQTSSGVFRGFVWTPGGTDGVGGNTQMKGLGTLGGSTSEAAAINRNGQITGYADTTANQRAFLFSGGNLTDIGSLLGNNLPNSFGYAINNAGHIAGEAYDKNYKKSQAFFYNGSTTRGLGDFGGDNAAAMGINDQDVIVGYWTDTNWYYHAFKYSAGVKTDLGSLGGHYTYAFGINNSGHIVGGSFVDSKDTVYHAFIYEGSALVDLNTRLDSSGAGWTLEEARAINDAGQIVGTGSYGGVSHMFLLEQASVEAAPSITGISVNGSNILVRFTTVNQGSYTLMSRASATSGTWSPVVSGIKGTGGTVTATDSGALSAAQKFYRVVFNP